MASSAAACHHASNHCTHADIYIYIYIYDATFATSELFTVSTKVYEKAMALEAWHCHGPPMGVGLYDVIAHHKGASMTRKLNES
jgi:hypothetical protein